MTGKPVIYTQLPRFNYRYHHASIRLKVAVVVSNLPVCSVFILGISPREKFLVRKYRIAIQWPSSNEGYFSEHLQDPRTARTSIKTLVETLKEICSTLNRICSTSTYMLKYATFNRAYKMQVFLACSPSRPNLRAFTNACTEILPLCQIMISNNGLACHVHVHFSLNFRAVFKKNWAKIRVPLLL